MLKFIQANQNQDRILPQAIDHGEPESIAALSASIKLWLRSQVEDNEGNAGDAIVDLIDGLMSGHPDALQNLSTTGDTIESEFRSDKCDLLAWMIVTG